MSRNQRNNRRSKRGSWWEGLAEIGDLLEVVLTALGWIFRVFGKLLRIVLPD